MKSVCVFCGSREGARPAYLAAARELGAELGRRGLTLVYGGASVGLMGALANAALDAGGDVLGVLPRGLEAREVGHKRLPNLTIVGTMHERKALMASRADAFVALPGGFGTLDELYEMTTWAHLGIHRKPVGVLDTERFWEPLFALNAHLVREGFASEAQAALLHREESPAALLDRLARASGALPGAPVPPPAP